MEVEKSWVEVDGAGWSWVHSLVIPFLKIDFKISWSQITNVAIIIDIAN